MSSVDLLGELLDHHRKQYSVDATAGGYSFVVSTDGAAMFLREIFDSVRRFRDVVIDDTPDTLFLYRRVPVRLRFASTPGQCYVVKDADLTQRSCCDSASVASVVVALTRASA